MFVACEMSLQVGALKFLLTLANTFGNMFSRSKYSNQAMGLCGTQDLNLCFATYGVRDPGKLPDLLDPQVFYL